MLPIHHTDSPAVLQVTEPAPLETAKSPAPQIPTTRWAIGVVIPARNEQATIAQCIESVLASFLYSAPHDDLWIVVVADTCTDQTAAVARDALRGQGEVIELIVGSAGSARRIGTKAALGHFRDADPLSTWLANIDADSSAPLDWLSCHMDLARAGEVGVAGIIELARSLSDQEPVNRLFRQSYLLADDGTHSHVHGANLGVRADAYLSVGGWSDKALAEDHCLWNRLKSRGWQVRSTTRSVVTTSPRLVGRAAGGFADTLRAHLVRSQLAMPIGI
jgi:cellulose synthase/poly-beta-1,6-N-acetylglucosamine synthase-like glycosyltransferase